MTDTPSGPMQVDIALVRQLADVLEHAQLTEIEVEDGDRRIRVARKAAPAAAPTTYAAPPLQAFQPAIPAPAAAPLVDPGDHPGAVKSPMVGTAYLSAEPGAKPFVMVGQAVVAGDTLLIVEAMKVMNPIVAPRAGTVQHLFVDNGQPVEFDQPLAIVE